MVDSKEAADPTLLDCVIVGGGPAGLTAAIYLARYHRKFVLYDGDSGRLAMIPRSHNHPGYPDGVAGADLLADMREQARRYGADLRDGWVDRISASEGGFTIYAGDDPVRARSVLLATGVVNLCPEMDEATHKRALEKGLLRYCPVCDAYEETDRRIGVIGSTDHGVAEALFLRQYSKDITLLALFSCDLDAKDRDTLDQAGIAWEQVLIANIDFGEDSAETRLEDGRVLTFDTLYPALGSETRNELGIMLGTELCDGICFVADRHQRTSVAGVYAAGDACEGLDQISVAMGHGAVAATAIHNDLRERDGHTPD